MHNLLYYFSFFQIYEYLSIWTFYSNFCYSPSHPSCVVVGMGWGLMRFHVREMSTGAVCQHYFSRLGVNLTPFGRNGGLNLMVSRSAIGFVDGWLDILSQVK